MLTTGIYACACGNLNVAVFYQSIQAMMKRLMRSLMQFPLRSTTIQAVRSPHLLWPAVDVPVDTGLKPRLQAWLLIIVSCACSYAFYPNSSTQPSVCSARQFADFWRLGCVCVEPCSCSDLDVSRELVLLGSVSCIWIPFAGQATLEVSEKLPGPMEHVCSIAAWYAVDV